MQSTPSPSEALPPRSLGAIFLRFLGFGVRAWGGPVAQVALMKNELVVNEGLIDLARFNRVVAVYQVLPGPEATELACYFGMLMGGRPGALVGGLGFVLPGLVCVLILSWLYTSYNSSIVMTPRFQASFTSVQASVAAMVLRAAHRIGEDAVKDFSTGQTAWQLLVISFLASLSSVTGVNFFVALAVCGVLCEVAFAQSGTVKKSFPLVAILAAISCVVVAVSFGGIADTATQATSSSSSLFARLTSGRGYGNLFLVGLAAGLFTFGGAYTAIPLVKQAVSGWMPSSVFLDGLALSSVVPAPLVIFNTFVGFAGHGIVGALLMTTGVFLPAFSFTLIGHEFFEKAVHAERIHRFLEGVTAGVVGLVAVTAVTLIKSCVTTPQLAAVYLVSLGILYKIPHRFVSIALILCSAVAGQALI